MVWVAKIARLAWKPFALAVVGRWIASALEVLSSSLLALSVVQLGGTEESELPIPSFVMAWIRAEQSPLIATLLLALAVTVLGQLVRTTVQWCLTWTHLLVNRKLTPEVIDVSLEPATHRLLDPPTAVQRWLLKIDVSYFIYESVAQTIGNVGTVIIILIATFRANLIAGEVALAGVVLWAVVSGPLIARALRASRRSAQAHEVVGRVIRDGAALRAELGRPSLRTYWQQRHRGSMGELQKAIKSQGIWNAGLFGVLGLISFVMPIVAVLASSRTASLGASLAVLLYLTRMSGPLESLASTLPWVQQNLISVQRLFQVVETDRDRVSEVPQPYAPARIDILEWSVPLPEASPIRYPDLTCSRGTILIVVGPSGSGKSSLLASLAGQRPATGALMLDGSPVLPSEPGWREACAYVSQEPELVPGELADNLHDFPGWSETPALAHAVTKVIASRTSGSEGEVTIDEKGVSVGQRRAISVLRAIGSNVAVLLLDEPVAGVDESLVKPIRDALVDACDRGRLVILTAHRHDLDRLAFGGAASVVHLERMAS
jgi:ABC-type multidrug transport system fused ATPase/permease subunit